MKEEASKKPAVTAPMTIEEVLAARKAKEEAKAAKSANYKKVYHLKKVDDKREIILKEGKKVIKTFNTKEEGIEYGKALAEAQGGTLLCHASKGKNKGKFQKV